MPRDQAIFTLDNFSGGLNDRYNPFTLPPGEFTVLENWQVNNRGQLVKRNGSVRLTSAPIASSPAIQGLAQVRTVWGLRQTICVAGGKIYVLDVGSESWTDATGTATLTAGQNVVHQIIHALGAVVGVDGTNAPWMYSYQPEQYEATPDSYLAFGPSLGGTNCHLAQGFQLTLGDTVWEIQAKLSRVGQPGGTIVATIATDAGGFPSSHTGWSNPIYCVSLPTDENTWTTFTLPAFSTCSAATPYHLLFHTAGFTPGPSMEVRLHSVQTDPSYPKGVMSTNTDRGWSTGWSAVSPARDVPFRIGVTAHPLSGSPPKKCTCAAFYRNYVFLGNGEYGDIPYPSRIWYSALADMTAWPSNQNNDFSRDDGGVVTALVPFTDHLIVFKDTSLHRCTLDYADLGGISTAFSFHEISHEYGCIGPNAWTIAGGLLFFADKRGICMLDPNLTPHYIGEKIETFWSSVDDARKPYICAGHERRLSQVWFAVSQGSGQATNNRVIVYHYKRNAFSVYSGIAANILAPFFDVDETEYLLSGTYDGLVQKQGIGTVDDSMGFTATATTGYMDLGYPQLWKVFRRIAVEGASEGNTLVQYSVNIERGDYTQSGYVPSLPPSLWGTMTWGQSTWGAGQAPLEYVTAALNGRGRVVQISLISGPEQYPPIIGRVSLFFKPVGQRF